MRFTSSQQEAINSNSPAILVLAGAGSGKTTVVASRIARLIKEGARPSSILAITFTRKAANELKERIERTGCHTAGMWIGTFHAISYRMLMQFGSKIGYRTYNTCITVIDQEDQKACMKKAKAMCNYKGTAKAMDAAILNNSANMKTIEDKKLSRVYQEYKNMLRQCNAVDFDLLLLEVHKLFEKHPEVREHYQKQFEHVFVDEYQDTNFVQYSLHEQINPENLFVVGDADQSIYGFRGADIQIILDFQKAHLFAQVIKLEECFRCGEDIVTVANNIISYNNNRIDKTLICANDNPTDVRLNMNLHRDDIADIVGEELFFEKPSEIAIISRTHRELDKIQVLLEEASIKYLRIGGKEERNATHDVVLFAAKCLCNEYNTIALARLEMAMKVTNKYQNIYDLFKEVKMDKDTILKRLIAQLQIMGLIREFKAKEEADLELKLGDWVESQSLKDVHSKLEAKDPYAITLLTAHASKGLEWDNVIVAKFVEGEFPSIRSIAEKNLEEERRLAYVVFTRARKRLIMIDAGKKKSSFIKEMEVENVR